MLLIASPVYKARDTIRAVLDSLVSQTNKKFLYMPVIDADGEDYEDIWEEYRNRGLRIYPHTLEVNGGPGPARQYAIDNAGNCDYIMFVDADDLLMPRAVDILYKTAKRTHADIIVSAFVHEDEEQPELSEWMEHSRRNITTWTHGKCYRVDYLKDNGIRFADDIRLNEDAYFNLIAMNSTLNKATVEEPTYVWRSNPNSLTHEDGSYMNFTCKSGDDYMATQVRALKFLIEHNAVCLEPELVCAVLIAIYNMHMIIRTRNTPIDEFLAEAPKLKDLDAFQSYFMTEEFWQYIPNHLKACQMIDSLIFYRMTFMDWLNEYFINKEIIK